MKTTLQPLVLSETKSLDDQIACSATLLAEYVSECAIEPRTQPSPNLSVRKVPQSQPKRRRSSISLAAVLIFLSGMFGAGLCLYQSQTSWTPAVRAIQDYRVGHAVRSENPTGELDLSLGDHIEPTTWRHLTLKAPKDDGSHADVELLRPLWWLTERDAKVGAFIDIEVPHCGIEGEAEILAINPCPRVEPTPQGKRTVIGTFCHHIAQVIDLYVDGLDEPIGTTPNHPFWSEDRKSFVQASELHVGEQLLDSEDHSACVSKLTHRKSAETVYNLEVHGTHAYCVSASGLVVHNSGPLDDCPKANNLRFAQKGISPKFKHGEFAGKTVDEVAAGLRNRTIHPDQLPIQTVTRDGVVYTLNNRSLMALRKAGLDPTVLTNVSGDPFFERQLTDRLGEIGGEVTDSFLPIIRGGAGQ